MTEATMLAYLAGAIDADGHITVTRSLRTKGKRYTHSPTYYHPRIGFTSTERIVPDLLQSVFGGSIHQHQPKNPSHKRVFIWTVDTAACGAAAVALLPFLRLKAMQAKFVVDLCALIERQRAEQRRTQKPPYRITPEQLVEREKTWELVTSLNQPRNRRVHFVGKARAGRLLDGVEHSEFPEARS